MKSKCCVYHLGLTSYREAWDVQNEIADRVASGQQVDTLLLLEHPHTYTIGRQGQSENLLWSQETLSKRGVTVHWVDRGGDITYHGPGQIVGYPILQLTPIGWNSDRIPQADFVGYIRKLEDVLICALAKFHLEGCRIKGKTGVWLRKEQDGKHVKIASIGVKVDSRGVSRHGFALNVNPDMDYWLGIIPCGLSEVQMGSLADFLEEQVEINRVSEAVVECFGDVFNVTMTVGEDISGC